MDIALLKILILIAAFGSALWNGIMHSSADRRLTAALMTIPQIVIATPFLFYVPIPSTLIILVLIASAIVHTGYILFLSETYKYSELSEVYPVAIGVAPVLNALLIYFLLQVKISWIELLGILLVSFSVAGFALIKTKYGRHINNSRAILLALITAVFIATYAAIDCYGIKMSTSKIAYISWLFVLKGVLLLAPTLYFRKIKLNEVKREASNFIIAGILSGGGYAVALWAFYYLNSPIVLALRATSIVFSIFIAVFLINESVRRSQYLLTFIIFIGVFLLVSSGG